MKLGVCAQVLYHLPFEEALRTVAELGLEAIELPLHAGNPFVDVEGALEGGWRALLRQVSDAGLTISALSIHQESQLLLGPHGEDTDGIFRGTPDEKSAWAAARVARAAALAERLEVPTLIGFTGCADYSRWFPWPLSDGYERMAPRLREALLPVLDDCARRGVTFAHECHPRQFAYDLETAQWAVRLVDGHPAFGFNFDPANLMLSGMDPVVFIAELGDRIRHVHAKDGERVAHHVARSGLLAHGAWDRPDRGFRFRVAGWGDLSWRRIVTELQIAGYRGVLAIEHEDPTMSRMEGLRQAVAHLSPIVLRDPPEPRWW